MNQKWLPRFARGASGFTLIEAMIGIALLGLAAVASIETVQLLARSQKQPETQLTFFSRLQQIKQALQSDCANRLSFQGVGTIADIGVKPVGVTVAIYNPPMPGTLSSLPQTPDPWVIADSLAYDIKLVTWAHLPTDVPIVTGGVISAYFTALELSGGREHGVGDTHSASGPKTITGRVPLYVQIKRTLAGDSIINCGTDSVVVDEPLYGGQKTSSQCIADGGLPYPTSLGLICRFPNVKPLEGNDYIAQCPNNSAAGGRVWSSVNFRGFELTATEPIVRTNVLCGGGQSIGTSGTHAMGAVDPNLERSSIHYSSCSHANSAKWIAGASSAAMYYLLPATGPMGLVLGAVMGVIMGALSGGCKDCNENGVDQWITPLIIARGCY